MLRVSKKSYKQMMALLLTILLFIARNDCYVFANPIIQSSEQNSMQNNENNFQSFINGESDFYLVSFKIIAPRKKVKKDKSKNKKIKDDFQSQNSLVMCLNEEEAHELKADVDVQFIEKDGFVEIQSIDKPNKNDIKIKNMQKDVQEIPWGISAIGSNVNPNKYDGKNIKIAIFDTGVSPHEDLNITGGISFVDYTNSYNDDNGHGTHVAGIIAARNNRIGIIGAAPDAEIYAVKILNHNGGGNYSGIIKGIE